MWNDWNIKLYKKCVGKQCLSPLFVLFSGMTDLADISHFALGIFLRIPQFRGFQCQRTVAHSRLISGFLAENMGIVWPAAGNWCRLFLSGQDVISIRKFRMKTAFFSVVVSSFRLFIFTMYWGIVRGRLSWTSDTAALTQSTVYVSLVTLACVADRQNRRYIPGISGQVRLQRRLGHLDTPRSLLRSGGSPTQKRSKKNDFPTASDWHNIGLE